MNHAFRLDAEPHFALRNASMAAERLCRRLLGQFGLSYPQYVVLSALWEEDGLLSGSLALRLGVNPSTVSRSIKRLERDGLVVRRRDEDDERTVHVWLTPAGRQALVATRPLRERLMAISGMTEQHVLDMHRVAERLQCESSRLG